MFVPAVVVVLVQSHLLSLAVDAHVQIYHALRKAEVVLEPAAAAYVSAVCRPGSVADDVPRLGRVDVGFHDAARRRLGVCSCVISEDGLRLVAVGGVRISHDRSRRRR